jgi:hypothetical protein
MFKNPSLSSAPQSQPARVIPSRRGTSILEWLEESGRLRARDGQEVEYADDQEEIAELMGNDDSTYEEDDFSAEPEA